MFKTLPTLGILVICLTVACGTKNGPPSITSTNNVADAGDAGDAGMDATFDPQPGKLGHESPQQCASCHEQHYDDWQGSMHAYATTDPIWQAMIAKGIEETQGELDQFCIQCHAPVASKNDMTPVTLADDGLHKFDLDRSNPLVDDGVVCVTCHAIDKAEKTLNAGFTLQRQTYYGPTGNEAAQEAHPIEQSSLLVSSQMCGTCHNVVNPKGALLENTFSEWYGSENNSGNPDTEKSCQDCHMPVFTGEIVDGVEKEIHRHQFVGVDLALVDFPKKDEQYQLVEDLLRSVAEMDIVRTDDQDGNAAFRVNVTNVNNGHALPSGSTADRQVWVHVVVKNEAGDVIFESGMLDPNGDLMDRVPNHSATPNGDPDLLLWGSLLFDESDEHVNFPWQAARAQELLLQPGQTGWREYEFPIDPVRGQRVTINATLRYRTFPPFLVRTLEEEGRMSVKLSDKIPIVDMAEAELSFVVQ